jgi:hypothetical protein
MYLVLLIKYVYIVTKLLILYLETYHVETNPSVQTIETLIGAT